MTAPLTDRDHALVEAVAVRVVELLADTQPPAGRLVDAAELARLLGVSRATIYDRADALGAVRLGDGDRPRLRFDPETALAAWQTREPEPAPEPAPRPPRRRTTPSGPELLPFAGRGA
jgi:DNA-binding FadR family transcriptional regulator